MSDLDKLVQHRDAILLAEVGAWLHDMGKCTDRFITHPEGKGFRSRSRRGHGSRLNPHKAVFKPEELSRFQFSHERRPEREEEAAHCTALWRHLEKKLSLLDEQINLGPTYTLRELIYFGRPGFVGRVSTPLGRNGLYAEILGRCHGAAHIEKEDPSEEGAQSPNFTLTSSPFGFESTTPLGSLDYKLNVALYHFKSDRVTFLKELRNSFSQALGDTRRPDNEVTLWDWSFVVAALYKTAIAMVVLTNENLNPSDICWKLFSLKVDSLEYLLNVDKISDLLVRREILRDAFDRIKHLLEEEYPLALEVYRDENGSIFVFPGLEDVLTYENVEGTSLQDCIAQEFRQGTVRQNAQLALQGEVHPFLQEDASDKFWRAQPPKSNDKLELPPVGAHISHKAALQGEPYAVGNWWQKMSAPEQICTVCGLRPQGPSPKAKVRDVCDMCEQRRADRSLEWATARLNTTIWLDEVADLYGRVTLVTGQFDLMAWVDGTLIRSVTVTNPANVNKKMADSVAKNPSFARLRRVWETTRRFWQEVLPTGEAVNIGQSLAAQQIGIAGPRLEIKGELRSRQQNDTLGPYHTYDLILTGDVKLSVVWDADYRYKKDNETKTGRFITCDNLVYIAKSLGKQLPTRNKGETNEDYQQRLHQWGAEQMRETITGTLTIEEPVGYGSQNKPWGEIIIQDVQKIPSSGYTPAIPILAEPRTFMALVPADKALAVVDAIRQKYEHEMGKVRNRLPLHLGVVYFHRRTPLRAALDAGRRMLKRPNEQVDGWQVCQVEDKQQADAPDYLQDAHFAQWREIALEHTGGRRTTWRVPLRMGDSSTPDNWYPYVFVKQDKNGNVPAGRDRVFEAPNPWEGGKKMWLVHPADLVEGDEVYFTSATFDFEWLDTTGRRFEIAYDGNGKRHGRISRPYLLDELQTLNEIWHTLSYHLTTTQIYALCDLVERKREEWKPTEADMKTPQRNVQGPGIEPGGMYWQFCRDAITNAGWQQGVDGEQKERQGKMPWEVNSQEDKDSWLERWADYAVRGWLNDLVELHLQVMKEEPETAKKEVTS